MKRRLLFFIFGALLACFVYERSVYAYLDPGSGSLVLQVIAALALSAAFTLRAYWKRFKQLFQGRRDTTQDRPPGGRTDGYTDGDSP